jgi:hypothetical protein
MVGDMFLMHELRTVLSNQDFWFGMTSPALSLWHMAIALNNTEMALFTAHPSCNISSMIEIPSFDFDVPFRLNMARGTTSYGARNTFFLLFFYASLIVMTDKTVGVVNGEVRSLDDLGVTRGAPKFNPPSQLTQMCSVREAHVLEYHIPL